MCVCVRMCLCARARVRALACYCVMEFNRACSPIHRVFMWVCARPGLCVDVHSEEEVPVFV